MFFTRTRKYHFSIPKDELKSRLIGKHVRIHNLDFEVFERENSLSIIPHAEQVNAIKTLPITNVDFQESGNKTKVVVTSKMRRFDAGGPMLVMIFCAFLFIAAVILFYVGDEALITITMFVLSVLIFALFFIRMQMGYFDYVRKVHAYVKSKGSPIASDMNMPLAM